MPVADHSARTSGEFVNILAEVFRKAGWRVRRQPAVGDMRVDLVVDAGEKKYVVEVKGASEGRRDRLIPLLSQAILQAQAFARRFPEPAAPLAVVAAKRVPPSVTEHLKQFAVRYAPEVGVGVIDLEGLRAFVGPGLEGLDAKPSRRVARHIASPQHLPDLFSDLNQWMLKILLGQRLADTLISVPREQIRNASQLAKAANVSVMSASRLVNLLADQGFLDESEEHLRLVRVEELLDWWTSSNREAAKEVPAHWILKSGQSQLLTALRQYTSRQMHNQPRCCLGLFAAADALGFGFVRGTPAHIYLERLTLDSLNRLGLRVDQSNRPADVYIRIPVNREAIFRARVKPEGIPVSDVLQVWLDVSTHPARGREQAREIWRRVLKPLFGKQR
jgi:Holliday junction resolvase